MNGKLKIGLVIAGMLALGAIGAGLFIESGYYNIGADDHHTKIVLAIIEQLRERSIGARISAAIWDVVSFVRKMPVMTPETYQQLSQGH
jgi:hypothetical protein